ncbi:hypothetical protein TELCIR_13239 [Teladorsagia circumcincta]|uniref:PDZ domain-containing protein n=1 Tax=Teladorsagia circumcincta TaxID=45464 RepID=A0A2G9U498_TELCI|nr:hypothetical protein TELCIR_13239 [Teladorsagia circumcincta]
MIESINLPRRKLLETGTQKAYSVENVNEARGNVGVLLKTDNAAGFGMNIQGSMNEGIYVKTIVPMGAADQTGNILPGEFFHEQIAPEGGQKDEVIAFVHGFTQESSGCTNKTEIKDIGTQSSVDFKMSYSEDIPLSAPLYKTNVHETELRGTGAHRSANYHPWF